MSLAHVGRFDTARATLLGLAHPIRDRLNLGHDMRRAGTG